MHSSPKQHESWIFGISPPAKADAESVSPPSANADAVIRDAEPGSGKCFHLLAHASQLQLVNQCADGQSFQVSKLLGAGRCGGAVMTPPSCMTQRSNSSFSPPSNRFLHQLAFRTYLKIPRTYRLFSLFTRFNFIYCFCRKFCETDATFLACPR